LAIAVLISEQPEQVLSSLQKALSPAHLALDRKRMTHYEQECNGRRNEFLTRMEKKRRDDNTVVQKFDNLALCDSNSNHKMKRKKIEK
ncbi:hypothetical protein PMAYCL1PPCAC_25001, partial [Pristionchus mayeri]